MKKKIASLLAVCMASTMLLAGCGGGNNGANSAEGGNGGPAARPAPIMQSAMSWRLHSTRCLKIQI